MSFMAFVKRLFAGIIVLSVSFVQGEVQGQVTSDPEVREVFEYLYSYQLVSADSAADVGLKKYPDRAEWALLKATVAWWQIVSGYLEDDDWKQTFTSQLKQCEQKAKDEPGDVSLYNTILVHAMRTRYDLLENNYFSAVNHLNASIDRISDSFDREENYSPLYLTSGLYYFFMQEAYDEYTLMRPYLFFYPDGDKEKGLKYLKQMSRDEDLFLRTEANYFLMRIYHDVDSNHAEARKYILRLLDEHPQNLMYRFFHIKVLWSLEDMENAEKEVDVYKQMIDANTELSSIQKAHMLSILEKKGS